MSASLAAERKAEEEGQRARSSGFGFQDLGHIQGALLELRKRDVLLVCRRDVTTQIFQSSFFLPLQPFAALDSLSCWLQFFC